MSSSLTPAAAAAPVSPWRWFLAGAAGAAVLGAGGAALYLGQHHESSAPAAAVALAPAAAASASVAQVAPVAPVPPAAAHSKPHKAPVRVQAPQTATKSVADRSDTEVADAPAARPTPKAPGWETPVAHPVCAGCGTVESVTPMAQEAPPSGLGAVAGAVLGGLLGNQFGGGDGKTLATIGGVVGGAYAGNTVEKRMHQQTSYRVLVRMDDGSTRSVEQGVPTFGVGARVRVQGNVLSPVATPPGQGT